MSFSSDFTISFRSRAPLTFKMFKTSMKKSFKILQNFQDINELIDAHRPHPCLLSQLPVVPQHLWVGLKYFHSARNIFTWPKIFSRQPATFSLGLKYFHSVGNIFTRLKYFHSVRNIFTRPKIFSLSPQHFHSA